ncbi:MAG: tetratricopeptide repeat protein [Deltaproteobacteria bacterium]|nr:tetratricopeptide repeat protein [Deltaproteobacteria bacterium]
MIVMKVNALWATVLIIIAFCAQPMIAHGDETGKDAKTLHREGVELFKASRFEEASRAFQEAYKLRPTWKLYYNIGQCEAAARHYGLALEAFETYLVDGGDEVPNDRREYISSEIRRIQPLVGVLEVEAEGGVEVLVNGTLRATTPLEGPVRVSAGSCLVTLKQGDEILVEKKVNIAGGMTSRVVAPKETESDPAIEASAGEPKPEVGEEPERSRLWTVGWIGLGVGATIAAVGAITGGVAIGKSNELKENCPVKEDCDPKYDDLPGKTDNLALATNILLPVGAAVAVTGVVLIILGRGGDEGEDPGDAQVSFTPVGGPDQAGLVIRGRF